MLLDFIFLTLSVFVITSDELLFSADNGMSPFRHINLNTVLVIYNKTDETLESQRAVALKNLIRKIFPGCTQGMEESEEALRAK